jgi:hypothetical protein
MDAENLYLKAHKKAALFYRYLTPKNHIKTLLKKGAPINGKWTPKNCFKKPIICDTKKPLYLTEKRRPKTGIQFRFYFAARFYGYLTTIFGWLDNDLDSYMKEVGFLCGLFILLVFIGYLNIILVF